jgi:hypothetical protein
MLSLCFLQTNLVDLVWDMEGDTESSEDEDTAMAQIDPGITGGSGRAFDFCRPRPPCGTVRVHDIAHAGHSVLHKLQDIRRHLALEDAAAGTGTGGGAGVALVSSSLDEVAYIYNIRGSDIPCSTVVFAYSIITQDAACLFIDANKLDVHVLSVLQAAGVEVRPYGEVRDGVAQHIHSSGSSGSSDSSDRKVWMDSRATSSAIFHSVPAAQRVDKSSPVRCVNRACVDMSGMCLACLMCPM